MYIHRTSFGGNIAIVEDYHTYRYNSKGKLRAPNHKKTTEQQAAVNARRSAQNIVLYAAENFKAGDYWIRLSYFVGERPENIDTAHKNLTKFLKKLKRKYKDLYYIGVTEEGTHGGLHHHLLIPAGFDVNKIIEMWQGAVYVSRTYSGELSQLASYLTKGELDSQLPEEERDTKHHKGVRAKKITKSANLKKPKEPKVKKVKADHWRGEVGTRKIDGYTYDVKPGSLWVGFTDDGYPYRRYIMIRREEYKNEQNRKNIGGRIPSDDARRKTAQRRQI